MKNLAIVFVLLLSGHFVQQSRAQSSVDIQAYLQQAQRAQDRALTPMPDALLAEASFRESAALAQLALERARQAGWTRAECRAIEELVTVYAGQRHYAAVADLYRQGPLRQTDNPYDVAIQGNGFFRLTSPEGEVLYTRRGDFQYDPRTDQLVDAKGYRLGISIPPDCTNLELSADGRLTAVHMGDERRVKIGSLQLATFAHPGGLKRVSERYYRAEPEAGAPTMMTPGKEGAGCLAQGHLEDNWLKPAPVCENQGLLGFLFQHSP